MSDADTRQGEPIPDDYDARGAEIERLRAQLADAEAARSTAAPSDEPAPPAAREPRKLGPGRVELNHGDDCPLCRVGVLYVIAEAENSVMLHCFNCGRSGSHDPRIGHQVVTSSPRQTPTGFTLSPAQLAARDALDPEEAAAANLTAEAGSGVTPQKRELTDA